MTTRGLNRLAMVGDALFVTEQVHDRGRWSGAILRLSSSGEGQWRRAIQERGHLWPGEITTDGRRLYLEALWEPDVDRSVALVYAYSLGGRRLWRVELDLGTREWPHGICHASGRLYVSGHVHRTKHPRSVRADAFVVALTDDGGELWTWRDGSGGHDVAVSVVADDQRTWVLGGCQGPRRSDGRGQRDWFIAQLGADGVLERYDRYRDAGYNYVWDAARADDQLIIVGSTSDDWYAGSSMVGWIKRLRDDGSMSTDAKFAQATMLSVSPDGAWAAGVGNWGADTHALVVHLAGGHQPIRIALVGQPRWSMGHDIVTMGPHAVVLGRSSWQSQPGIEPEPGWLVRIEDSLNISQFIVYDGRAGGGLADMGSMVREGLRAATSAVVSPTRR